MKKKAYIKPEMEIVTIESSHMLAASIDVSDEKVDAGEAWSNGRRGVWGNLWADDEKE